MTVAPMTPMTPMTSRTPGQTVSPEPAAAPAPDAVRRRTAERSCALTRIFRERPQLAGVHDRADLVAELALWSV